MSKTDLCRELRCLGFDTRPVKNGVLVEMYRPFSRAEMQLALNQVGAGELDTVQVESNLWLVQTGKENK